MLKRHAQLQLFHLISKIMIHVMSIWAHVLLLDSEVAQPLVLVQHINHKPNVQELELVSGMQD